MVCCCGQRHSYAIYSVKPSQQCVWLICCIFSRAFSRSFRAVLLTCSLTDRFVHGRKSRGYRGSRLYQTLEWEDADVNCPPRFSKKYCSEFTKPRHFKRKFQFFLRRLLAPPSPFTVDLSPCPQPCLRMRLSLPRIPPRFTPVDSYRE